MSLFREFMSHAFSENKSYRLLKPGCRVHHCLQLLLVFSLAIVLVVSTPYIGYWAALSFNARYNCTSIVDCPVTCFGYRAISVSSNVLGCSSVGFMVYGFFLLCCIVCLLSCMVCCNMQGKSDYKEPCTE